MAHYAFLDDNNIVTEVIVGKEENENNIDWEQHYGNFRGKTCKRTSYNTINGVHVLGGTPFRINYAGIGHTYNETLDGFIEPKPFPSWILDEEKGKWNPPVAYPETYTQNLIDTETGNSRSDEYVWNEKTQSWTLQTI